MNKVCRSGITAGDGEEVFSSSDSLDFLEVTNFEESNENAVRQGLLHGESFSAWLDDQHCSDRETVTGQLTVVFSEGYTGCRNGNLNNFPLRLRHESFQSMSELFRLPSAYMQMLFEGCHVFIDAQGDSDEGVLSEHVITHSALRWLTDPSALMLQNTFTTTSRFSAALSYDSHRRCTYAFVHGLSQSEMQTFCRQIVTDRDLMVLPTLLPYLLLCLRVEYVTPKVLKSHLQMIDIETQTGLRTVWHPGQPCCSPLKRTNVDFESVTRNLTSLTAKVSYCEYCCEIHEPMLDSCNDINRKMVEAAAPGHEIRLATAEKRLRTKINFLRSSLKATHSRARYLSKRAQAQVQTVYSLIAQKDNALSMRDNAALKTISEDQKRIALTATRDSAAMRIIAGIATIFVPATFTATLFSTTFFNFQVNNQEQVVSRWLWLYFVVTVFLSSAIMVWWHLTSRRKVHEINVAFGEQSEQLVSKVDSQELTEKTA